MTEFRPSLTGANFKLTINITLLKKEPRMISKDLKVKSYQLRDLERSVTDLINRIVQILKRDLKQVRISAQKAGLMEPVKP